MKVKLENPKVKSKTKTTQALSCGDDALAGCEQIGGLHTLWQLKPNSGSFWEVTWQRICHIVCENAGI